MNARVAVLLLLLIAASAFFVVSRVWHEVPVWLRNTIVLVVSLLMFALGLTIYLKASK